MNKKRLALTKDGKITYCSAVGVNIGKRRCNHIDHQNPLEDVNSFLERVGQSKNKSLFLSKKIWAQNIYIGMAMENRNVTYPQTEQILNGINVQSIDLFDLQSILDNRDAWRELHESIFQKNDLNYACKMNGITARHEALFPGEIRTGNVSISGVKYVPKIPDPEEVKKEYNKLLRIKDVKSRALELFCFITRNQIFWDGNKRTALLIANKELISNDCGCLTLEQNKIEKFNSLLTYFYETGDKDKIKEFLRGQIVEIKLRD